MVILLQYPLFEPLPRQAISAGSREVRVLAFSQFRGSMRGSYGPIDSTRIYLGSECVDPCLVVFAAYARIGLWAFGLGPG
jgi:hypothetical protein